MLRKFNVCLVDLPCIPFAIAPQWVCKPCWKERGRQPKQERKGFTYMANKEVQAAAGPEIVDIGPEQILADSNVRYNLKRFRLDNLKAAILRDGRVTDAIEIEPLSPPQGKMIYRLTTGHYRHAAVTELNNEGAGLLLPAQIVPQTSPMSRLRRQISENIDREDFSPIDKAIAMKAMLDLGASKLEVREAFSVPGGRKGLKMQALSNSSLNIHLGFLEFSKAIQEKIHDGRIGVLAAMELGSKPKDKHADILERVEAARQQLITDEEKAEEKFLAAETKIQESEAKIENKKAKLKEAEEELKKAVEAEKAKADEAAKVFADAKKIQDEKIRLAAETRAKILEGEAQTAEKKRIKLQEKVAAVTQKIKEDADKAKEKAKKAEADAKAAKKAADKPVSAKEIAKAAKEADGEETGLKVLNRTEIMKTLKELTLPGGSTESLKVNQIAQAFIECFESLITDDQLYKRLKAIVAVPAKSKAKEAA